MITPENANSLKARAIPAHVAIAAGISSAQAQEVSSVLGIQRADSGGMLIPYIQPNGQPVLGDDGLPLIRVRVDEGTPKYQGAANAGFSVYLPPLLRAQILATTEDAPKLAAEWVAITEGEFKALSVEYNLGFPCVGLPGVTMYRDPSRDKSEPATATTPLHPHLDAVLTRARGVIVIADSDAAENIAVRSAMLALREAIAAQYGIPCAYVQVPGAKKAAGRPSKDAAKAEKLGIDDWIQKVGTPGVDGIRAFLKKAFAAEVARLKALSEGGYTPLGYTVDENTGAGAYYVYSVEMSAVTRVLSGDLTNINHLIHACGADWLKAMYPKPTKSGETAVDTLTAGGDLAKACKLAGFWSEERRVGGGVWPIDGDRSAIVVNTSSGLWASDGRAMHAVAPEPGGRVYMSIIDLGITPQTEPATAVESAEVLDAMRTWTWSDPRDAGMATGWLAAAFLCGALDVRPMLYVSGRPGTGKSTLLGCMREILGPMSMPVKEGTSLTEPALRRALGRTSRVSVIDEAESTDNPARLQQIITYIRSSFRGGTSDKASNMGSGVDTYVIRTMTALGAINPMRLDDSEQSRFIRLHMQPRIAGSPSHDLVTTPASARELGTRLAARMVRSWPRFTAALSIAQGLLGSGDGLERYRDTLGTVIAAGWTFLHDGMPTVEAIRDHMATLDIDSQRVRIVETRSDISPLEWLLDKVTPLDVLGRSVRLSLRELVIPAGDEWNTRNRSTPHADALGRLGIRIGLDESGERVLFLDPIRGELEQLFSESRWGGRDLEDVFKTQVPGCKQTRYGKTVLIGSKKLKPMVMPLGDLVATDEEDIAPRRRVLPEGSSVTEQIATVYAH